MLILRYEGLKGINQDTNFPVPVRGVLRKESLEPTLEMGNESIFFPRAVLGYKMGKHEYPTVYILPCMFTLIFLLKKNQKTHEWVGERWWNQTNCDNSISLLLFQLKLECIQIWIPKLGTSFQRLHRTLTNSVFMFWIWIHFCSSPCPSSHPEKQLGITYIRLCFLSLGQIRAKQVSHEPVWGQERSIKCHWTQINGIKDSEITV